MKSDYRNSQNNLHEDFLRDRNYLNMYSPIHEKNLEGGKGQHDLEFQGSDSGEFEFKLWPDNVLHTVSLDSISVFILVTDELEKMMAWSFSTCVRVKWITTNDRIWTHSGECLLQSPRSIVRMTTNLVFRNHLTPPLFLHFLFSTSCYLPIPVFPQC